MRAETGWAWSGIHGDHAGMVWSLVWPMLAPCVELDGARYDEDSVFEAIRLGDMQLWLSGPNVGGVLNPKLAVTTEIRVYPKAKWCNIKFVGGQGLPFAFDFLGTIEDWARAQGCVGCEGYGRPEWSRILQSRGYRERARAYDKRFQDA